MRRGIAAIGPLAAALLAAPLAAQPAGAEAGPRAAPGIKIDRNFIVGFWSDKSDCTGLIEFLPGGAFVMIDSGDGGAWRLEGDALTLTGTDEATVRLVPISRDELTVVNADGSLGHSRRCPAPVRGAGDDKSG
jgi:hypothetical protein